MESTNARKLNKLRHKIEELHQENKALSELCGKLVTKICELNAIKALGIDAGESSDFWRGFFTSSTLSLILGLVVLLVVVGE